MLLEDLIIELDKGLNHAPLTINEVNIGVFYTAVQLSDGHVGTAFTPRDLADTVCCPSSAAQFPEAGKLSGKDVWSLAGEAVSKFRLRRAVGIATLNALSARLLEQNQITSGKLVSGADALDIAKINPGDKVAMIGGFTPFIRKLKNRKVELKVVDKHRDALKGDEAQFWVSPDQMKEALSVADVAIITGSALVEGGIDELLEWCLKAHEVVMAGPTASLWPEPFFARGVTIMGGIIVRDGPRFMRLVAEGGSGYFFDGPAFKVAIVKSSW